MLEDLRVSRPPTVSNYCRLRTQCCRAVQGCKIEIEIGRLGIFWSGDVPGLSHFPSVWALDFRVGSFWFVKKALESVSTRKKK